MKALRRILFGCTASLLLAVPFIPVGQAHAQSTNTNEPSDVTQSIWSGLRQGVNAALGRTTPPSQTPPQQPTPPTNGPAYVAMGDSVAAGQGLAPLASPSARDTQCKRSAEAYSSIVGATRNVTTVNVACAGATAGDLVTSQGVDGANIPPQIAQAFAGGKPQVMSITAGANDIHWATFLNKCMASTCGANSDSAIAHTYMSILKFKLAYAFSSIKSRSHGSTPPTVIVTGYYNPVSAQCSAVNSQLTPSEIAWFNTQVTALNQTIQEVANHYSFVRFAPVDFTGHDLCSASPWVQGLQDPAPIHPTAAGQQAIAEAVLAKF